MHNIRAYLAIQICTVLFGLSAIIGERIQSEITDVVFGRSLFALVLLGGLLCQSDKASLAVPWRDRCKLMLNGAQLAGHWFCFFMGVREGGVAIGTLGFATFPAFVIIFESALRHKKPAFLDVVLMTMIVAGVYILAPVNTGNADVMKGLLWSLAAGFSNALVIIFNRYIPVRASATQSSWWQCTGCLIATLSSGPAGLFYSNSHDIVSIGILGLVCTGLAYWMLTWGLQRLQARTVAMLIVLEPVYALILAWLFLNQRPDGQTIAGAILIISASLLSVLLPARSR